MGLIINRPSEMSLVELFAQLGLAVNHKWVDTAVVEGGPVAEDRGIVLHSDDQMFESSAAIGQSLVLSTAMDVLEEIAADRAPKQFLVALGYAGWGPGQLEGEIAQNVWLTTPADAEILFSHDWSEKLQLAAKSLGFDFRLIAGKAGHG
jgi:putative transcriptional regulator